MIENLPQLPELPQQPRPIVSIGAGGIVRDSHLPAYRIAGFQVHSIFDLKAEAAQAMSTAFGIPNVAATLDEAVQSAPEGVVFDVAVPASAILDVLPKLPDGSFVLIQKPMGEDLAQSKAILEHCHKHGLKASINFQLRYSPYVRLAREIIGQGLIGELVDMEVRLVAETPWNLWTFLNDIPRMEILYHSIHYVDLMRSFYGEPRGVWAQTIGHPRMPRTKQIRSTIALDYGPHLRSTITTNHGHNYGPDHQESYIKWEGTKGAIYARMGLLLDYPKGRPDLFQVYTHARGMWEEVPLQGSWFPHAFMGPMSDLMRFAEGSISTLPTSVEDAYQTMAVVEAAYRSNESGATPI